jgi:hypothetical protein
MQSLSYGCVSAFALFSSIVVMRLLASEITGGSSSSVFKEMD